MSTTPDHTLDSLRLHNLHICVVMQYAHQIGHTLRFRHRLQAETFRKFVVEAPPPAVTGDPVAVEPSSGVFGASVSRSLFLLPVPDGMVRSGHSGHEAALPKVKGTDRRAGRSRRRGPSSREYIRDGELQRPTHKAAMSACTSAACLRVA